MPRALPILVLLALLPACGGDSSSVPVRAEKTKAREASPPTPAVGAAIPGGGLSVEEAVHSPLRGPLMVRGHLVVHQDTTMLCSHLVRAARPACGAPSLRVTGLSADEVAEQTMASSGGLRWSSAPVSLLGTVRNGELRVPMNALG